MHDSYPPKPSGPTTADEERWRHSALRRRLLTGLWEQDLEEELLRHLPFTVRRARKGRHSVYVGASMIHAIMSRKHFWIRPECSQTIKSIQQWTMKRTQSARSRDPHQHAIDALRYGLLPILDYRPIIPQNIKVY